VRTLRTGRTVSASLDMSTVGLSVTVTIFGMVYSPAASHGAPVRDSSSTPRTVGARRVRTDGASATRLAA
jgi:hypothetical protein